MSIQHSQTIRVSLPPGTKLKGGRDAYVVKQFLCMSERSLTVLCESGRGNTYRLKIYNGQNTVTEAARNRVMATMTKGVLLPVDQGIYNGCSFFIYPQVEAVDTTQYPISQTLLVKKIIPQLAYVIRNYHMARVLLRDICPEHILYRVQEQQILYCGFSNMALLPERATITKEAGYGQHPGFIAPEVHQYGYSTCSDYYALGMTLLCLLRGKNPMQDLPAERIYQNLKKGIVPGIDVEYLKKTPYSLYSEDDKVAYLILGLLLPNPRDRWGAGELRCWCNHQQLPLVRKEGKITYQYTEPFIVNRMKCWNYKQLTEAIAADPYAWSQEVYKNLDAFAKRQKIQIWTQIEKLNQNPSISASGKIFRAIYGLNPALNGLWWQGTRYPDMETLTGNASKDAKTSLVVAGILKNKCLSYFLQMRKRITAVEDAEIRDAAQMEEWELQEPGVGVHRCVMRYTARKQNQRFIIDGREYKNPEQLLKEYRNQGMELKRKSNMILKNQSFMAWLWAQGMNEAAAQARDLSLTQPEQSFYLLMKIAETVSEDTATKVLARKLYLTYGEFAPIYWLINAIDEYKAVSIMDEVLYEVFENASAAVDVSLEELSTRMRRLIPDYNRFAQRTVTDAKTLKNADLEFADFSFYPLYTDGYFNCTWENGMDVSLSFLKSIGER